VKIVRILDRIPAPVAAFFTPQSKLSRVVRPLVNTLVPKDETLVTVRSGAGRGIKLLINPRAEKMLWTGTHEPAVQQALVRCLSPGDAFWDIGAHVGFFSLLASRIVGSHGAVHAFEPIEENRVRLSVAIEENSARNIVVHAMAVGATSGVATMFGGGTTFTGSLVGPESREGLERTVQMSSLDDLAAHLQQPTLLKIDVEGAELGVLSGGSRLFADAGPAIVLELHDPDLLSDMRRILRGYAVQRLDAKHYLFTRETRQGPA
jgi:FkbM family methyltransferase